jgi:hypothetical protein
MVAGGDDPYFIVPEETALSESDRVRSGTISRVVVSLERSRAFTLSSPR